MIKVKSFCSGPLLNNVYLLWDNSSRLALIVDPALESQFVSEFIIKEELIPFAVVNTHCHFDHCALNSFFCRLFDISLFAPALDRFLLDNMTLAASSFGFDVEPSPQPSRDLRDNDLIMLGEEKILVRHAPGHTPGHIILIFNENAIVGDVIFEGSVGRTDLPGGDFDTLTKTLKEVVLKLPPETILYPGHGPKTSLEEEKSSNPFLNLNFK